MALSMGPRDPRGSPDHEFPEVGLRPGPRVVSIGMIEDAPASLVSDPGVGFIPVAKIVPISKEDDITIQRLVEVGLIGTGVGFKTFQDGVIWCEVVGPAIRERKIGMAGEIPGIRLGRLNERGGKCLDGMVPAEGCSQKPAESRVAPGDIGNHVHPDHAPAIAEVALDVVTLSSGKDPVVSEEEDPVELPEFLKVEIVGID